MLEFDRRSIRTWSLLGPSGAHGAAAMQLVETREDTLFLTADLCFFSGMDRVREKYPDRLYNVGIAEQNMVGVAAGLAREGFVPFVSTYASFCSSRCADQVRVNMSYMRLPIKMVGLTAGYGAGILGATHMGIEDVALMRALPNITVISPADCSEIVKAMIAVADTPDPTYIRLTGAMPTPIVHKTDFDFRIGRAIRLREGEDVCIIATGSMVSRSLEAAKFLESDGISCTVLDVHTIKPLDTDAILDANERHKLLVVAEEHSIFGGLYGAVSEVLSSRGSHRPTIPVGIDDTFVHAGSYIWQMSESGLTSETIKEKIMVSICNFCGGGAALG